VVTAIIALARSLGLRVVAEGVETCARWKCCTAWAACPAYAEEVMQGFLFSSAACMRHAASGWVQLVGALGVRRGRCRPRTTPGARRRRRRALSPAVKAVSRLRTRPSVGGAADAGDWPAAIDDSLRLTVATPGCRSARRAAVDRWPRRLGRAGRPHWPTKARRPMPLLASQVDATCTEIRRLFPHRQHLVEQLGRLCAELTRA
jgi:EAL domain-containing protein (putative c-di-GMP-specific phosphodiesterase class I)